ncbi:hypothetical protein [Klebsiella quasipneumoniae]|uniref:hypothetical protein n=1 Tax=Klebsiella quasipneumoniae TaxID=1463165 RepID=UPI00111C6D3F|nr:hypothetical protein [Klebsiella quasipneumoniae]
MARYQLPVTGVDHSRHFPCCDPLPAPRHLRRLQWTFSLLRPATSSPPPASATVDIFPAAARYQLPVTGVDHSRHSPCCDPLPAPRHLRRLQWTFSCCGQLPVRRHRVDYSRHFPGCGRSRFPATGIDHSRHSPCCGISPAASSCRFTSASVDYSRQLSCCGQLPVRLHQRRLQ